MNPFFFLFHKPLIVYQTAGRSIVVRSLHDSSLGLRWWETQEVGWFIAHCCKLHIGNGNLNKYPGCFQVFPWLPTIPASSPDIEHLACTSLALPSFPSISKDVSSVCLTFAPFVLFNCCKLSKNTSSELYPPSSSFQFLLGLQLSISLFFVRPLTFGSTIQKFLRYILIQSNIVLVICGTSDTLHTPLTSGGVYTCIHTFAISISRGSNFALELGSDKSGLKERRRK